MSNSIARRMVEEIVSYASEMPNSQRRMVEQQQEARIEYEKTGLSAATQEAWRGQILGFCVALAAIAGAAFTAYIGAHPAVPVALVSVPVLGLVRAIVRPRQH
jgi:hypothetical protein